MRHFGSGLGGQAAVTSTVSSHGAPVCAAGGGPLGLTLRTQGYSCAGGSRG